MPITQPPLLNGSIGDEGVSCRWEKLVNFLRIQADFRFSRRRRAMPARPVNPDPSSASVAGSGTGAGPGVPGQVPHRTFVICAFKAPPVSRVVRASGFAVTLNEPQSFAIPVKLTFAGAKIN